MAGHKAGIEVKVRPLTADDLETVIAIDTATIGRARRGFFERRLEAALKEPKEFVYIGADDGGTLTGFMLVRLIGGEFGGSEAIAVLDAVGVAPSARGRGVGRQMLASVDEILKHKQIDTMDTQTPWSDPDLVGFLGAMGFAPGPRMVLERGVGGATNW